MKVFCSRTISVLLGSTFIIGCGDPMEYFDKELKSMGYIRYATPMQESGTGTLVGGGPKDLAFVAHPNTCFPDQVEDGFDPDGKQRYIDTKLRFRDDTTVPKRSERVYFNFDAFVDLFKILGTGSPSIKAGVGIEMVKGIDLEMNGVHVEYMDSINLSDFYRSDNMRDVCKDYLDSVAFIIQALKVEELKFTFFDRNGVKLEVDVGNISEFLDIGTDINWRVERRTSLIIDTPKYIGYQLGALRRKDDGMALVRATKIRSGKFEFKELYVFDDLDRESRSHSPTADIPIKPFIGAETEDFDYSLEEIFGSQLGIKYYGRMR